MIYEAALGLSQDNLACITIGFNRGRVVTFKLKFNQVVISSFVKKSAQNREKSPNGDYSLAERLVKN